MKYVLVEKASKYIDIIESYSREHMADILYLNQDIGVIGVLKINHSNTLYRISPFVISERYIIIKSLSHIINELNLSIDINTLIFGNTMKCVNNVWVNILITWTKNFIYLNPLEVDSEIIDSEISDNIIKIKEFKKKLNNGEFIKQG
jgi:hypothetical protein